MRGEMDKVFEYGDISEATPEQLQQFLRVCCTGNIPNDTVHPREIVRGITINHVQMARTITKLEETIATLNRENDKVATRVLWLTFICAGGTIAQVIIALCR